ncbi:RidA family protein [uncultured Pseudacidovorax sp.]|uniref:RidA family protein n=1 Tax=uncultured Pseudacidovorax sp. TaxID=679313 RepID=UPI0025CF39BE|nr:RidA family protein [uncultured Pseudacidovorax sp.]
MPIERFPTPLPVPFSKAVRAGGFLFVSGVLPMDAQGRIIEGDIQAQTRAVLERVAQNLADCGARMAEVVRATIWLADLGDFAAFNQEYARHFAQSLPARSCVQAELYGDARVEIEVQAWVGG